MADENKTTAQEQEAEKKEEKKQDPKKEEGTSENLPKTQEEMDRIKHGAGRIWREVSI